MKWMFILLLIAFPARAQQVHKCASGDGQVSYQSAPCEAGQRTLQQWQAPPEPVATPPLRLRLTAPVASSRKASAGPRAGAKPRTRAVPGSVIAAENNGGSAACMAAKRKRQDTLERVGLKRTYALLQRLDNAVWRACN